MAIREGDRVMVTAGKDRGRVSRVARVLPKQDRVVVESVNTAKRHQKARGRTIQGGIVDKDIPIHISNVMLVCNECGPVRVRAGFDESGRKFRRCGKCGDEV